MKIGIDARLYSQAGIGRYIKNLIVSLEKVDQKNCYLIFLRKEDFNLYVPSSKNFHKVLANYQWYSLSEQIFLPIIFYKSKLDLLHVPHFNFPALYFGKTVITIHDNIMHSESSKNGFKYSFYRILFFLATMRATKIIVPSKAVKESLDSKSIIDISKKITVIYEAVDLNLIENKGEKNPLEIFEIKKPYILFVGRAYPHKNLRDFIIAFKNVISKSDRGFNFVIAGKRDKYLSDIKAFSDSLGLSDRVKYPSFTVGFDHIPDALLTAFYKNASCYVSPSLDEGFNLPILEAMSFNVPCLISKIPCHEEIFHDAARFFDPTSILSMETALEEYFENSDLDPKLFKRACDLVASLSWTNTARQTLATYEKSFSSVE